MTTNIHIAAQALEALDELEAAARGDEPFPHFAAPLIRQALEAAPALDAQGDGRNAMRLELLRDLISNDAHALSFQTMGQYRTAILKAFGEKQPPPAVGKPLTRSQINAASREAQIAFCLDKQPTYEVALARAAIAKFCEVNGIVTKETGNG